MAEAAVKKSNEIHSEKKIKLYEEIFNNKNVFNTPKKNNSRSLDIISKLVDEKERIVSQRVTFKLFSSKKSEVLKQSSSRLSSKKRKIPAKSVARC